MGSLAVLSMADHTGPSAQGDSRPVHPFFTAKRTAPSDTLQDLAQSNPMPGSKDTPASSLDGANDDKSQDEGKPKKAAAKRRKRAKAEPDQPVVDDEKPRAKKRTKAAQGGNIAKHFGGLAGDNTAPDPATACKAEETASTEARRSDEKAASPKPLSTMAPSTLNTDIAPKPTKMLKFNPKTGTIGSPPPPKTKALKTGPDAEAPDHTSPASTNTKRSSKLVSLRYGDDDASRKRMGEKVDAILKGFPKAKAPRTPRKKKMLAPEPSPGSRIKKSPPKIAHPFFAGKGKVAKSSNSTAEPVSIAPQPPKPKRDTIQTSTPISPRRSRTSLGNANPKVIPQFSVRSGGLKFPGQKAPAWPWKDMVHVRGYSPEDAVLAQLESSHSVPVPPSRKSKGRAVELSVHDSLIDMVTQRMNVPAHAEAVRNANSDDFVPPPPELRLPTKHFESGNKLQLRVFPQLKCSAKLLPNGNARGSKRAVGKDAVADDHRIALHPAQLVRLFNSVRTSLSAFDRADCDNVCWAQKYAPTCAAEIIQPGKEAFFLKEWLQALVVQSIDTGSGPGGDQKAGKEKGAKADATAPKKKTKKRKKLDDFIVSSGEESGLMDEVSDNDHDWTPSGKFGIVKKTVIRAGDRRAKDSKGTNRLTNALVISGPHGCGKTAAVYAVAKELDFEVFEINSSSRRSGKDVDDKIGDMLRHHHVSHDNASKPVAKEVDAEAQKAADDLAKEIASGKQKTMASFFTKKTAPPKPKPAVKPPPAVNTKPAPPKEARKDPPKGQKQSLILLDEVDILYDEDKQFWARVIELIVKSKRPFIMTCNDETLVPLHNLNLHGIFRLSAPPTDLAVDRLLLIAANEGHALRREPVEALYVARNHDLRAATMELNYWCQIGVGDRRGGFDWFYPRWPKGVDLDDNKEVVRVVSEDTYQLGMGWLGRDMVVDKQTPVEEEILQQSWDLWNLDAGHWQDSVEFSLWARDVTRDAVEQVNRLRVLGMYDTFADAMSAADICSSKSFAQFQEELIDATKSDLCRRSADDYVLGLPVLDAPPVLRYDRMSTMLPNTLKSTAKAMLQSNTGELFNNHSSSHLHPLNEKMATAMIRHHFSTTPIDTPSISRIDFSLAFDPIAASEKVSAVTYLDPSVLDRNMELITLDVAPYVRSIVAYDQNLQQQRLRLSNLISEGGRQGGPKRMRTTRAAYSALEGGSRTTTRGDKWFKADLNPHLVMKTGGEGWTDLVTDDGGSATLRSTPSPTKPEEVSPGSVTMQESPTPKKPVARKGKGGRPRKTVKVVSDDSDDELA